MNSKNAVHAQLFFDFKQFLKNDMRLSGQALFNHGGHGEHGEKAIAFGLLKRSTGVPPV